MAAGTALVAGAAGIIGDAVMRELDANGWTVRGLSRRPSREYASVQADLTDAEATAAGVECGIDNIVGG
jgi:nucleoside-diphosphate-sugar epimerase